MNEQGGAAEQAFDLSQYAGLMIPAGILCLWIGLAHLWNHKYRPMRINSGHPTATFNNILGRGLSFIFKEDVNPNEKLAKKKPALAKFLIPRNIYIMSAVLSAIVFLIDPLTGLMFWCATIIGVFARVSKVFSRRFDKLSRMFEVANVNMKYTPDMRSNPWGYIQIKKWDNLYQPGKTIVYFPPTWKADEPRNREAFEQHFTSTVTKENEWVYEWEPSESIVTCSPVPPLPDMAHYPGSTHSVWNKIPLGLTPDGEATWDVSTAPHALLTGTTGAGKSTLQRNIIFHCIQFPNDWIFMGIDVKQVELTPYLNYDPVVASIAINTEEGVETIRYAAAEMHKRYTAMKNSGINHFKDLNPRPKALMVMIDESYMFLAPSGIKTDEGKAEDMLKGEASKLIGDIARLGRAAGVHLVMATQRPDATVIYGELKQNLACRIAAGRADTIASQMTLDDDKATRLPSKKGRGYMKIFSEGTTFQGYYAEQGWIDDWINGKVVNPHEAAAKELDKKKEKKIRAARRMEEESLSEDTPVEKKGGLLARLKAINEANAPDPDEEDEIEEAPREKPSKKKKKDAEFTPVDPSIAEAKALAEMDFEDAGVDDEMSSLLEDFKVDADDFAMPETPAPQRNMTPEMPLWSDEEEDEPVRPAPSLSKAETPQKPMPAMPDFSAPARPASATTVGRPTPAVPPRPQPSAGMPNLSKPAVSKPAAVKPAPQRPVVASPFGEDDDDDFEMLSLPTAQTTVSETRMSHEDILAIQRKLDGK